MNARQFISGLRGGGAFLKVGLDLGNQPLAGRRHRNRLSGAGTGQRAFFMDGDKQLESDQVETADQAFLQHRGLGNVGSGGVET